MNKQIYRPLDWHKDFLTDLREAINRAGSRAALARHLGVDFSTISDWLRGSCPRDHNLDRLRKFLTEY